jgi:hypothetical protein
MKANKTIEDRQYQTTGEEKTRNQESNIDSAAHTQTLNNKSN